MKTFLDNFLSEFDFFLLFLEVGHHIFNSVRRKDLLDLFDDFIKEIDFFLFFELGGLDSVVDSLVQTIIVLSFDKELLNIQRSSCIVRFVRLASQSIYTGFP